MLFERPSDRDILSIILIRTTYISVPPLLLHVVIDGDIFVLQKKKYTNIQSWIRKNAENSDEG